jgi:RimJ/RimL family protein N-acetyltransferase
MLKGDRVILRAVERDDMKRFHELERNVELVLLGDGEWQPKPLAALEKEFDKDLEREDHSFFAIVVDDKLIGGCGLHHSHRRDGSTEFGIGIYDPEYIGKGYGSDAIRTLLRWAFCIQNWRRVHLRTLACNERAIRAYQKIGFVEEGRLRQQAFFDGGYVDEVHMGMLRSEWDAQQVRQHG